MNIEQVARGFVTTMNDVAKTKAYMTADAMASGGMLPQPIPAAAAVGMVGALVSAMPDMTYTVDSIAVQGDKATVHVTWGGTQTGALDLGMPGIPAIPATGKKVSVKDTYILTVYGDKVAGMHIDSPATGGMPAALGQLGVKLPGM